MVNAVSLGQTQVGGGGGTGPTITSIRTGTDIWVIPIWDGVQWTTKQTKHDWDQGTPGVGKWYVDGSYTSVPPIIPTGWYSTPPDKSGSVSMQGSFVFTITYPSGQEHPDSIWVAVSSSAEAEADTPSYIASLDADDGLQDAATGGYNDMISSGKHLRKVSVGQDGLGTFTVSVHANANATGSNVTIAGHVSAGLSPDPRSVGIASSYEALDLSDMQNYYGYYCKYHGVRGPGGNFPVLDFPSVSQSYNKASRVPSPINYSDNVTLSATYFRGLEPSVWYQRTTYSLGGYSTITVSGKRTTDISSYATSSGDVGLGIVSWHGSHNETSSSGFGSSTDQIVSTVDTDGVHHVQTVYGDSTPTTDSFEPYAHKTSGNFGAKFTFSSDGMVAEAKINYTYKPKEDPVTKLMEVNGLPSDKTDFQTLVGWYSAGDDAIIWDLELEDRLAMEAFSMEVIATLTEETPISTLFSIVAAGLGESLHTSLISRSTKTISRSLAYYWKIDIDNWQLLYPGESDTSVALKCNEWMCGVAPDYKLAFHVVNEYGDDGFVQRRMGCQQTCLTKPGDIPTGDRYYHYRIAGGGGGNGGNGE